MKKRLLVVAAAGALGAGLFAGPLMANPPGTNYNVASDHPASCQNASYSLVYHGPLSMWPPNHKYQDIYFVGTSTDPADQVTLDTSITHDQYDGSTEQNGAGHTFDDAKSTDGTAASNSTETVPARTESGTRSVQTDWQIRAERSGRISDGRHYTLTATVSGAHGTCSGNWTVTVPHDQGN